MDSQTLGTIIRRIRGQTASVADVDLVQAFADHRDAAAFAEVVRRHGPMVLGVCRRVLRDSSDADDAFQATFLVLFRKAGTLRRPDRLAGWVHQVALRTAKKVRAIRTRRQGRETELFDVPAGESPAELIWRELRPIFDEELNRLPDKLRLPAVLCFLEGRSKAEAARVLGWPDGTVSARLQRARERLRSRFTARGLVLSGGALAVALFNAVESAAVSETLIQSTILQATAATAASAGVRTVAEGVLQAMYLAKLKAMTAVALVAGVVGTGTGLVLMPGAGPGKVVAGQPAKDGTATPLPQEHRENPSGPVATKPSENTDRSLLQEQLDLLKERLAWEERMVKKGYMTESQLHKTKTEIASVEKMLTGGKSTTVNPRRKELESIVQKMEEIVKQQAEGVRKGVVPLQELHNSQLTLYSYKLRLLGVPDEPEPTTPKVSESQRAEMQVIIKQMEQLVEKTEEMAKKGITPMQEVVNMQRALLEHKFKFALLPTDRPAEPRPVTNADARKVVIEQKAAELAGAEELFKQKAISMEEVRRLRIELARLRAEAAEASSDYKAAVDHREAILVELRQVVDNTRKLVERKIAPRAELRVAEVAFAEAAIERLRTDVRKLIADIVSIREQELREAKSLFEAKAISVEELRHAEQAVSEAKARLSAAR